MVLNGSGWLLVVLGGFWWILVVLGSSWGLLVVYVRVIVVLMSVVYICMC